VEIGPGRGALTDRLAARAKRLVAIEVDRDLVQYLRARYADRPHVEIVEGDVLNSNLADLAGGPYVLAGNVPYYITTPIIFHALMVPRPETAVYLVQKEVADRMVAPPGDKTYGALSVNLQAVVHVEFIRKVAPGSFNPPPAVDSAVVRVTPREAAVIEPELEAVFRSFVLAAFGLRRKQLVRVVRTVLQDSRKAGRNSSQLSLLMPVRRSESYQSRAVPRRALYTNVLVWSGVQAEVVRARETCSIHCSAVNWSLPSPAKRGSLASSDCRSSSTLALTLAMM
jgi:ribosomal RNA small subunit methyltransferase A